MKGRKRGERKTWSYAGRNPGRERMYRIRMEAGCKKFQRMVKARKHILDLVTRAYFQRGVRCGSS